VEMKYSIQMNVIVVGNVKNVPGAGINIIFLPHGKEKVYYFTHVYTSICAE